MDDVSIGELRDRRRNAWKNFKRNRSYIKPTYYGSGSIPIGDSIPKLLNTAGQMLLRMFREADLALNEALFEREKIDGDHQI